jgi:hypothetical protein
MATEEFEHRKGGKFPYDISTLDFTGKMNDALASLEAELMNKSPEEVYPNIFIIGLSRSGTTLLSQTLFNCLDIACTNNLMAKFWKTPLVGAHLSKMVLNNEKSRSYESNYGRTKDAYAPHEAGWFWSRLFNVDPLKPTNPGNSGEIDWQYLRSVFININHILTKPVVYKPAESIVTYLEEFDKCFTKPIYIYIERDVTDVAISHANARIDYYGSLDTNWSSPLFKPEEYKELENQPYEIQIAGQIFYFSKVCNEKLSNIGWERVIKIKYESFCSNPQAVIDEVKNRISKNYNYTINQVATPPAFDISHPTIDTAIKERLRSGLLNFFHDTH